MTPPNDRGPTTPSDPGGNGPRTGEPGPRPARSDDPPAPAPAPGGRVTETGETPPWQRGAQRSQPAGPRPADGAEGRPAPRGNAPGGSADPARAAAAGAAAGATAADPEAGRGEPPRPKDPGSELPDLSVPRPPLRKPGTERDAQDSGPARPSARVQVGPRSKTSGPVRASMQIRHIDPWSTLKVSLLLSVAMFFVWMISVAILYLVLGGMGVWSKLNSNVGDLLDSAGGAGELVSAGSIFGGALLIGLVNIVLLSALATVGAFVYNLSTDIVGGIEVTLADRD